MFIPERWRSAAVIAGTIIAAILVCYGIAALFRSHVAHRVDTGVTMERAQANANVAETALVAERAATANDLARRDIAAENEKELSDAASQGDNSAVGPGTSAVLKRLRDQQSANRR